MAERERYIDCATHPERYKHWQLRIQGRTATLAMDVQEDAPLVPGYELKLNSYDLGVDIELYDAVQRLRFEHPEVAAVVITSAKPRVFCAGRIFACWPRPRTPIRSIFASLQTRPATASKTPAPIQDRPISAPSTAQGGGYELALACAHIMLVDDGSSAVSLPELPLLAVLPGTGGLTRLVDKRRVRHDHADVLCTTSEGIRGQRAVDWRLVDELVPRSRFDAVVQERAAGFAARSDRPGDATGITLTPLQRTVEADQLRTHLTVTLDRDLATASFLIQGPREIRHRRQRRSRPPGRRFGPWCWRVNSMMPSCTCG